MDAPCRTDSVSRILHIDTPAADPSHHGRSRKSARATRNATMSYGRSKMFLKGDGALLVEPSPLEQPALLNEPVLGHARRSRPPLRSVLRKPVDARGEI